MGHVEKGHIRKEKLAAINEARYPVIILENKIEKIVPSKLYGVMFPSHLTFSATFIPFHPNE